MYKAKVAVYSEIHKNTQHKVHHVEFFNVKPGGTQRNC